MEGKGAQARERTGCPEGREGLGSRLPYW